MKIDWKRKLTSRKWWVSVAALVSGLILAFGGGDEVATTVSGCIMATAAVVGYTIGEVWLTAQTRTVAAMAITFEAYARNNGAFRTARKMPQGSPAGIIIHSTGANNPNLRRYVNAPDICGTNPYLNYFDRADCSVCPHAVIGLDKSGEVRAAKLLPWNYCCWGCGSGSSGSYNYSPAYIQIEVCEDGLTDRQYFEQAFGLAAELCKRLTKNYPTIKPENIISHHEAHLRGYASNHADCDHWLSKFGKSMDWFRGLVAGEKQVIISAMATLPESSSEELQRKLSALGMTVTAKYI